MAEYSGLVAALTMARAIDPAAMVEARLDSKLVVEQMSGRWKIKHEEMRRLALQARADPARGQVTYQWIPRELNSAADRLANEAMDLAARGGRGRVDEQRRAGRTAVEPARRARSTAADRPRERVVGWDVGPRHPTTMLLLRHGETAHTVEQAVQRQRARRPAADRRSASRQARGRGGRSWPSAAASTPS